MTPDSLAPHPPQQQLTRANTDTLLERQPTGRVGKPEDLAGLVIYLSTLAGAHSVGKLLYPSPEVLLQILPAG